MKIMKKKFCVLIILCMLISTIVPVHVVAASKIKLNKKTVTIETGKTYTLVVQGSKQKVKWNSSNKKVATVNANGKVTGKKPGTVKITAKVGKKTLKCTVKVKPILSANKTNLTIALGTEAKVKVTLRASATVSYKIKSGKNVVSCSWGKFKKNTVPLTIKAKAKGTATIVISNTHNKEKVKICVIVPGAEGIPNSNNNNTNATTTVEDKNTNIQGSNPWEGVEVVIPKTIGEQSYPSNRMEITNYSFYNAPYSGASYYYMNYQYKLVEYGKTSKSNWGEYFYCYDKNGNILKSCYMYASSLALNRTYIDDAMIPLGTAKIVFMEYPDIVKEPETNEPGGLAPKKTGKTILKEYIMRYGSTNSDGEKLIKIVNVKDGAVSTFGIIYKNSTDSFRFMMTYERSDCGSVMSIDVPNTDVTLLMSEFVFVYLHQSGGFSAKGMIDMETYNENTDIDFKITESSGFNSETMKLLPTLADTNLKLSMSGWDVLLANKVGITMKDIGFLSYN